MHTSTHKKEGDAVRPGLFGQKHSSRNYTNPECWGKNQFNSSFPASLVAYMYSKGVKPVYLKTDAGNKVTHDYISADDLFGISPLDDNAFYNFEAGFTPFEKYYSGKRENIDLVMVRRDSNTAISGLDVKLTAIPDNTTKKQTEDQYGCEIVVRPPTICFLACSICSNYDSDEGRVRLRTLLSGVPKVNHWEENEEVARVYNLIEEAVMRVSADMWEKQKPLILQPVWKTKGDKMILADDCLDVFAWSNLAMLQMCKGEPCNGRTLTLFHRAIVWVYKMLFEYIDHERFDYLRIVKNHTYGFANDKAFAMSGIKTREFLRCAELTHPRISKYEIKNIILGGGQDLLSPERRFDAVIVNSPEIF